MLFRSQAALETVLRDGARGKNSRRGDGPNSPSGRAVVKTPEVRRCAGSGFGREGASWKTAGGSPSRVAAVRRDPGGGEGHGGTGPRQRRRQRTHAGIKPLEASRGNAARHTRCQRQEGRGRRRRHPIRVRASPRRPPKPHGRYRVKAPERPDEEQVAEVVENGVSGTTAGVGKPVLVDSSARCAEGDGIPGEALRGRVTSVITNRGRLGSGPPRRRPTSRETPTCCRIPTVGAERAKTSRVGAERRNTEDGEVKANEASSAHREALKRR